MWIIITINEPWVISWDVVVDLSNRSRGCRIGSKNATIPRATSLKLSEKVQCYTHAGRLSWAEGRLHVLRNLAIGNPREPVCIISCVTAVTGAALASTLSSLTAEQTELNPISVANRPIPSRWASAAQQHRRCNWYLRTKQGLPRPRELEWRELRVPITILPSPPSTTYTPSVLL